MALKPELQFSESFHGKVWQLLVSEDEQFLIVEVREESSMSVRYFHFNILTLQLTEMILSINDWWVSLEGEKNGIVCFKQYNPDDNPEVISRFGFDLKQNVEIENFYDEKIGSNKTYSPTFYPASNQHFGLIKKFIKNSSEKKIVDAGADYFETDKYVMVSYYIEENKLANYLLITDMRKEVVFHELLANNLNGIGQETFLIVKNKLIFVQQKQNLCIYQLT